MATINGSTTQVSGHYQYYITWSEDQVNVANNTSRVRAWVYVKRTGWYYVESSLNSHTLTIDGTNFTANPYINMNTPANGGTGSDGPHLLVSGSKIVSHNSNGSKSISISSTGQVAYVNANYSPQYGSASATVNLTTIPREAYLTNTPNFTVGNNIGLNFSNSGSLYVRAYLYVNNTLVKYQNMGTGSSGTFTMSSSNNNTVYSKMPSSTSVGGSGTYFKIRTYSNSGYSSQVGGDRNKNITAYVNQSINKPTFTNYTLSNVSKTINVVDKYSNTLQSNNTTTLLGSSSKLIKGYSNVRATISSSDKMVAKNYASGSKYRLTSPTQQTEGSYTTGTRTLDLSNVQTGSFTVTAFDSRNLTTTVSKSLTLTNYVPLTLFNMELIRDNQVDAPTKLKFEGDMFKGYFGGGTSGVENDLTVEYRWKPSTSSWGAQTWNDITDDVIIDGSGNISYEEYIDGNEGTSGFTTGSSFDVEIRGYDKLSHVIIENTLSVGEPLMDATQDGVAFGKKYNSSLGGKLQIDGMRALAMACILRRLDDVNIASGSWTTIAFNSGASTNKLDPLGMHSTSTNNSRATIKREGWYQVTGQVKWNDATGGGRIAAISVNGSQITAQSRHAPDSSGRGGTTVVNLVYLEVDDYVELEVWQGSGSTIALHEAHLSLIFI